MQTQTQSDFMNRKLTANFRAREFICPCCQKEGIQDLLVEKLQAVHDLLPENSVIIINSGYRCQKHNESEKVRGKKNSSHLQGWAADIKCRDSTYRFNLINALLEVGFNRFGFREKFLHVDIDPMKPKGVMW